jgi:hypothetical protein
VRKNVVPFNLLGVQPIQIERAPLPPVPFTATAEPSRDAVIKAKLFCAVILRLRERPASFLNSRYRKNLVGIDPLSQNFQKTTVGRSKIFGGFKGANATCPTQRGDVESSET